MGVEGKKDPTGELMTWLETMRGQDLTDGEVEAAADRLLGEPTLALPILLTQFADEDEDAALLAVATVTLKRWVEPYPIKPLMALLRSPGVGALGKAGTWYAVAYQRTPVNTECKYLLLKHAFEDLGCIRVQFKTDLRNERSQRALYRIGAIKEGILRNHMIMPDGTFRDSVYYSILASEWPKVKTRLEEMMKR